MTATLADLAARLDGGQVTSEQLVTDCLEKIANPQGEGARTFTAIAPERAIADARAMDAARKAGRAPSPHAGIPVSVKCLFDVEGFVTTAGSKILAGNAPAASDAPAIARLKTAGFVVVGHTNMTEFAYSGLGMNPHYGTPGNPADRARIPGGSSSGAAVSVADGMAALGIGTDTGGSCRIPAAFCGLTGYKPTARRVPTEGAYPLSQTLDSIGSIAHGVADCAIADAVMAGEALPSLGAPEAASLHVAVLENFVLDGLTPGVAAAFEEAIRLLERAGVRVSRLRIDDLDRLPSLNAHGGIIAAEALAIHRDDLATREAGYDPRVSVRIRKGETMEPGEYEALLETRRQIIARADDLTRPFDAVIMPTVAMEAPRIADLDADEALYGSQNILALRNTTVGNFLDRCAISLPLPVDGLPVGLMLMGETMGDARLFDVATAVEKLLTR